MLLQIWLVLGYILLQTREHFPTGRWELQQASKVYLMALNLTEICEERSKRRRQQIAKRHITYVIKTVIWGTWVRYSSREDSGVAR